jgi:hypothetical protein
MNQLESQPFRPPIISLVAIAIIGIYALVTGTPLVTGTRAAPATPAPATNVVAYTQVSTNTAAQYLHRGTNTAAAVFQLRAPPPELRATPDTPDDEAAKLRLKVSADYPEAAQ